MFATYRYARKQYRKRQATKADAASSEFSTANETASNLQTGGKALSNHPKQTASKKCQKCAEEKSAARKYRWKLLLCLLPAFFDASLDLTIVATALPQIASHFDKFNQLNWIVTSFTLTSTAFIPVFGSLADTFGRYAAIQTSTIILTVGSILCAVAPNWAVLLLGRALQGMGTAGVQNVAMIILADMVSLREQAINTSIFQLLNGIGYSVGPVIGGYLTNSNWRYCFALCSGLSVVSCGTLILLRNDLKPGTISIWQPTGFETRFQALAHGTATLDLGGSAIFILSITLIILGTSWGGSTYAWNSPAVIVPLVIGVLFFGLFILWESLLSPNRFLNRVFPRTVPMIPSSIFSAKDVRLVCIIASGTGAALYSVFYFIGIYFTVAEGYEASEAGKQLLYYVPGLGVGVYGAILVCNVWPRQTFWPLCLGTLVETTGIAVLSYAVKRRNATLVNVMMGVAGAGTGMRFMPSGLHLAGMFRDRLAPAYSLLRFALPFGGTLALTIMGSVFQNKMADVFGSSGVSGGNFANTTVNLHNSASLDSISLLPEADQEIIRSQGATATMWSFISILPILGMTLVASLGLGNVWISKPKKASTATGDEAVVDEARKADGTCARHAQGPDAEAESAHSAAEVLEEVYLLALIQGNVKRLKKRGPDENGAAVKEKIGGAGEHLKDARQHDAPASVAATRPSDEADLIRGHST